MHAEVYPNNCALAQAPYENSIILSKTPLDLLPEHFVEITRQWMTHIAQNHMSESCFRVITAVFRHTLGFNKYADDMSGTRLQQITQIRYDHANAVVRALEKDNALIIRKGRYGHWLSINFNFASWKKEGEAAATRSNNPRILLPDYFRDELADTGQVIGASLEIDEATIRAGEIELQCAEQKNLPEQPNLGHTITNNNLNKLTTTKTTNSSPSQNSEVTPTTQPSPTEAVDDLQNPATETQETETAHLAMFNTLLDTMSRLEQRLQSMETKIETPPQAIPSSSIPAPTTPKPDPEPYSDPITELDNIEYNSYTANNFHSIASIAKHLPQLATESNSQQDSIEPTPKQTIPEDKPFVEKSPIEDPLPNEPFVEVQTDPVLTQSSVPAEATSSVELSDNPPNTDACPVVVKEDKKSKAKAADSPSIAKMHTYEDLRYPDTLSHMIKRILGNRLEEHHIASDDAQNILDLLAGRLQKNDDDPIRSVPAYLLGLINKFKRNDLDLSPLQTQQAIKKAAKPQQTEQEKYLDKLQWEYREAMTEYRHFENNFRVIAAREGINLQDYLRSDMAKPIWLGVKKRMEQAHTELHAALEQQNVTTASTQRLE